MLTILWWAALQGAVAGPDRVPEVRRAVERSLPWIEAEGVKWIRESKCTSCHHVTFMLWSHREALGRGFPVDAKKLGEWSKWSVDYSLATPSKGGERGGGVDTMAQLLLGRATSEGPEKAADELSGLLVGYQKPEGYWQAGGQLPSQRRPKEETNEVTTRWILLALRSMGPEDAARKAARERAEKWLADRKPGKSTESLALALALGRSPELLRELLLRQNEDGGWAFLSGEESDALATGQVLYVLAELGRDAEPEPIRRAREFLLRTQLENGSWKVRSTKTKPKHDQMSSYWGTNWAVIGLLRTLPE